MTTKYAIAGARHFISSVRRHQALMYVALVAVCVVGSSRYFIGGRLLSASAAGGGSSSSVSTDEIRACSSVGTMFEGMTDLKKVMDMFRQRTSSVVGEREKFLATPSTWICLPGASGDEPPMPMLQGLANELPGWHFQYSDTPGGSVNTVLKPMAFGSFASILSEFEREYECKLSEFQEEAFERVYRGDDIPSIDAPQAQPEYIYRLGEFHRLQLIERQRARTAVERTIHALRSIEINYVYAKQLVCFQRASLDLKNELGLLADATSCMPRIWDALTSLHDRKQ